jgi:GDSL-like Lipase/Acylhydrolase family
MKDSSIAAASPEKGHASLRNHTLRFSNRKVWLFRFAAVTLGLAATIVFGEATVRLAGWPAPGFYVQGTGPIELRLAGRNGGAFPPGVLGELRHYDYSVECRVNRFGFRDRELVAKSPGEWRIGLLGDSFTAGIGVNEEDRFGSIFAATVQKRQPTTVWNLGAPLCGTACEAEMLDAVKDPYALDEVVLAFYGGNDLEDNEVWYQSRAGNQVGDGRPRFDSSRRWLREHLRLTSFLWVNVISASGSLQPPGVYTKAALKRYWPNTEKALEHLRQEVPAQSLTILYLPAQPEWDDAAWQQIRTRLHASDEDRFVTREAVKEWTISHGMRFVDATLWLRACQPAAQCIFPTDPHWTSKGHRIVADGLIGYWQKRN